jgi:hypothetical protein
MSGSSSTSSHVCNPVFPEGANADTHYRIKDFTCASPCECPVKERPAIPLRGRSYGTLSINDGAYTFSEPLQNNVEERRGLVRYSSDYVPEIFPKVYRLLNNTKSFDLNLFYRDYKYFYRQGSAPIATNLQVEYQKKTTRITSTKNPISDVKSFVSQYAGCDAAHKLRKRAIALARIHSSISDEVFRFGINDL